MKIALIGYGKMGKAIHDILRKNPAHEVVLCIHTQNSHQLTDQALQGVDLAIEFSRPEHAPNHLSRCFQNRVPVVCGTTGWLHEWERVAALCHAQQGTLLYASNFSIGVNLFFKINRYVAQILRQYPHYQLGITEIHHTQKLDAPSGTAISLAKDICQENPHYTHWHLHPAPDSPPLSIPITAERQGTVIGTHIVDYQSDIDTIQLSHIAHNRNGFAQGAVFAAEWLSRQPSGIYSMQQALELIG